MVLPSASFTDADESAANVIDRLQLIAPASSSWAKLSLMPFTCQSFGLDVVCA